MALKLRKVCWTAKVREKQNPESLFPSLSWKESFLAWDVGLISSSDGHYLQGWLKPELFNLDLQEQECMSQCPKRYPVALVPVPILPITPFGTLDIHNKLHLELPELDFSSTKIFINLVQRYGSSRNIFLPLQLVGFEIISFFFFE